MKNKKLIITTASIITILAVAGGFYATKRYNLEMQEKQRIANELQTAKDELIKYINDDEFITDKESYLSKVDTISIIDDLSPIKAEYDEAIVKAEELAKAKSEALSKLEELNHVDKEAYKEKIEKGSSSIEEVESLIDEAEAEEALAKAKSEALNKLEELSHIDTETYKSKIEASMSIEDIESLISEATSEEEAKAAKEESARAALESLKQQANDPIYIKGINSIGGGNNNDTPSYKDDPLPESERDPAMDGWKGRELEEGEEVYENPNSHIR